MTNYGDTWLVLYDTSQHLHRNVAAALVVVSFYSCFEACFKARIASVSSAFLSFVSFLFFSFLLKRKY